MNKAIKIAFICVQVVLLGCSTGITRHGYEPGSKELVPINCAVAIRERAAWSAQEVEVLGKIKVDGIEYSAFCSETDVLSLLVNEACVLGADMIHITDVKEPDFITNCDRLEAEFLRFKDRDKKSLVGSDPKYYPEAIEKRFAADAKYRNEMMNLNAAIFGSILGSAVVRR